MLGAIIGDIVGSVYEWDNIRTKEFPFFSEKCFFTDDTVMTIAVAEALMNGGKPDNFIDSMKKFGKLYPNSGYGGRFGSWLHSDDRKPYNSFGNGSAMRVAPCAWYANSLEEAEELAKRSADVTHNHSEGIKGAQSTAAAIYLARTGKTKSEIKDYIENKFGYDLSRTLDEIRPVYQFNETCQQTVPEAIIAFLESRSFEDAIGNAISIGGDSDTVAAITGSIAEAAYRIPDVIITNTFHFLDDMLASVINAWLDNDKPLGSVVKKSDWETKDFSKPQSISVNTYLTEKDFARIRYGLFPEAMEDKWFIYFENGRLCFHRSWTGCKIYEIEINKAESRYDYTEIIVERDAEIYSNTDNFEDELSVDFLICKGLLGMRGEYIAPPGDDSDEAVLKNWSSFGNMIL